MKTYYTIYKITNKLSGKIYIGSHKTTDLDDNYMGSGKYLKHSIDKHGIENFNKEILFIYDNAQDMYLKEAEIVNEDFLAEENTYNLKIGGFGGWDYINENIMGDEKRKEIGHKFNITMEELGKRTSEGMKNCSFDWTKGLEVVKKKYPNGTFYGKTHSNESKQKISKGGEKRHGKNNGSYNTRWIHSLVLKQSKRIKKDDPLPDGWNEGRKMKF